MPPVANDAIMLVTIDGRQEGQQVLSVFAYNLQAAGSLPNMDAAIDKFWAKWSAADGMLDKYCRCLSERVNSIKTRLQLVAPARYAFRTKVDATFSQGLIAGNCHPVNTSIAITKRTDLAGRSNVGTLHMPGVSNLAVLNGELQAAGLVKYTDLGDQMLQPITTIAPDAVWIPTLYHKVNPQDTIPITAHEISRYARVMRRRTVGVGA